MLQNDLDLIYKIFCDILLRLVNEDEDSPVCEMQYRCTRSGTSNTDL